MKFYHDQHARNRELYTGDMIIWSTKIRPDEKGHVIRKTAPNTYLIKLENGRIITSHIDNLKTLLQDIDTYDRKENETEKAEETNQSDENNTENEQKEREEKPTEDNTEQLKQQTPLLRRSARIASRNAIGRK
jgi:Sec-independent protein translocase protein TatA